MSCVRFVSNDRERILQAASCTVPLPFSPVRKVKRIRLQLMAESGNPKIREAAASHPDLPRDLMLKLMRDPETSVRNWAARNYSMPADLLNLMSITDEDESIRVFAKWRLAGLTDDAAVS